MDRNLVISIVLSIVIIVAFQYFFQSFSPPPAKKGPSTTEGSKETRPPRTPDTQEVAKPPAAKEPVPAAVAETHPVKSAESVDAPEKDVRIKVDTPKYRAIVSSVGGRIVSFELKDYKLKLGSEELVNLFPRDAPDTSGPSIIFTRRDERFNDSNLRYRYDSPNTSVSVLEKGTKKSITFRSAVAGGIAIEKTYTFSADDYSVGFSFALTNNSKESRNYLITLPWKKAFPKEASTRFAWDSAEILLNGELKDYYFQKIQGDEVPTGNVEWAGLGSVYFFKALVFGQKPASKVTLFKPSKENVAEIRVPVRRNGCQSGPNGEYGAVALLGTQRTPSPSRSRPQVVQSPLLQ